MEAGALVIYNSGLGNELHSLNDCLGTTSSQSPTLVKYIMEEEVGYREQLMSTPSQARLYVTCFGKKSRKSPKVDLKYGPRKSK